MRAPAILALAFCLPLRLLVAAEGDTPKAEKPPAPSESPARDVSAPRAELSEALSNFTAAFNKGEAKLLLACFTSDADWIDDQGAIMRGRTAILRSLEDSIAAHKGRTLTLRLDSVRTLGPDVAVGNATSTFAGPDKSTETAAFIAVYVKQDGKWLISVLTETSEIEDEE